MMNARANFAFFPPLLNYERMYANHHLYNELIEFLEKQGLVWTKKMADTVGKRFVHVMSKALFQPLMLAPWYGMRFYYYAFLNLHDTITHLLMN
jgi:hypothetical protein